MFPSPCLAIGASFRWLYLLLYTFFLLETRLWLQTKHISIFPGYPRREHFSTGASADFLTVLRCFCVVISVARLPTAELWNILRPHGRRPGPTAKHLIAVYPKSAGLRVCADRTCRWGRRLPGCSTKQHLLLFCPYSCSPPIGAKKRACTRA